MSQETTNTFSKGLIMDLNPLTTPNDTLVNCLNGTFITYNGNEFVLLNDMGNGRVETAYLPSGYVPVGIKEHGGIIYVASYNPLTNRSLIGSFPSPERNISSEELNKDQTLAIRLKDFFNGNELKQTVTRLLLSDNVIRSGDKFSVMVKSNESNLFKWISNWYNTFSEETNLVEKFPTGDNGEHKYYNTYFRHKKLITLLIATEDSSGNLIDITEQLKRTVGTNNDVIEFTALDPPKIKFNAGLFLQYSGEGGSSDNIDNIRNSKALNTYNNKVFGNLYIVATLNSINSYSVSVHGIKDDETKEATLTFEVTYEYNCPDGGIFDTKNLEYNSLGMSFQDACNADWYDPLNVMKGSIILLNGNKPKSEDSIQHIFGDLTIYPDPNIKKEPNEYVTLGENSDTATYHKVFELTKPDTETQHETGIYLPEYNEDTELYTVTNSYDISLSTNTGVINYELIPEMIYGKLDGLKIAGSINLDLLGSGLTELNVWKYYINDGGLTDITWGMQSYPKYGEEVKKVIFDFIELADGKIEQTLEVGSRESYNGVFTNSVLLEVGKIYIVKIRIYLDLIENTFDEDKAQLLIEWKAVIMDPSYYNSLYKDCADYLNMPSGKSVSPLTLSCNYSNSISKSNFSKPTSLMELTTSSGEKYEYGTVSNTNQYKIDHSISYTLNSEVFTVKNADITPTITITEVSYQAPQVNIINDLYTIAQFIEISDDSWSIDGESETILVSSNLITLNLDVPIYATAVTSNRKVEKAYAPLSYRVKDMLGITNNESPHGNTLYYLRGLINHVKTKKYHREINLMQNQTEVYRNYNSGDDKDAYLPILWDFISIPNMKNHLGVLPYIVFISVPYSGARGSIGPASYSNMTAGWHGFTCILCRNTEGNHTIIGYLLDVNICEMESNMDEDENHGNIYHRLWEKYLRRIYTYLPITKGVGVKIYTGYLYTDDFKLNLNVLVHCESGEYKIYYKDHNYEDNLQQWFTNIEASLGIISTSVKDFLSNQKLETHETNEEFTIPSTIAGSRLIYNTLLSHNNEVSNGVIAILDYDGKRYGSYLGTSTRDSTNTLLTSEYWYYYNPETKKLDPVPTWLEEHFTVQEGYILSRGGTYGIRSLLFLRGEYDYDRDHWCRIDFFSNSSSRVDYSLDLTEGALCADGEWGMFCII